MNKESEFLEFAKSDSEKAQISEWLEGLIEESGEEWVEKHKNHLVNELRYILDELGLS